MYVGDVGSQVVRMYVGDVDSQPSCRWYEILIRCEECMWVM